MPMNPKPTKPKPPIPGRPKPTPKPSPSPRIKVRTSAEDNSSINKDFSKQSVMKAWGTISKSKRYQNFLDIGPDTWWEGDNYNASPTIVKRDIKNQILDYSNPKNIKKYGNDLSLT